jgi:site-specific recombinase XerD
MYIQPITITQAAIPATLVEELETAKTFAAAEKSEATRKAYRSDFKLFVDWCDVRGLQAIPASVETVGAFLAGEATRGTKASTISRRAAAIRYAHAAAGLEPPTSTEAVKAILRGIRRTIGKAQVKKAPVTADRLLTMLAGCPDNLKGIRDRALLALGFSGAFRRSELVALTVEDLQATREGMLVTVRHSKTDQEGAGQEIAIPNGRAIRPVDAVLRWLEVSGITSGPIFRPITKGGVVGTEALSAEGVANLVKHYAGLAGLKTADFAGHSLRSGFITSAAENAVDALRIAEVSRHKSLDVLRGYVRRVSLFREHAGAGFL